MPPPLRGLARAALALSLLLAPPVAPVALADAVYQPPPFSQGLAATGLITVNDDWSGVPGIVGYRGDGLTSLTGADPQTLLDADAAGVLDVNANQTNPASFTTGGVAEFELTDPVIALNGSSTADAPYLLVHLNTTGLSAITVQYTLRDLDASADDALQPVALHFRTGAAGDFINVPGAFVADATQPNTATLTTPVSVTLPLAANNQAQLQLRIMTANAAGNDEWVGVDDLRVTGVPGVSAPRLRDLQGAGHLSPYLGGVVGGVPGVVTALRTNGFYVQDPSPDADPATSEAVFVFTSSAPAVAVGDSVVVTGTVTEFRAGGASADNLTVTELISPVVQVLTSGAALPAPIVIGAGGRVPPSAVIDDDSAGDVEIGPTTFDPAADGLDFYESLEGMRVQLNNPVAVGPTSPFGEIPVVGDAGAGATGLSSRGALAIGEAYSDFNPERVFLDNALIATVPQVGVGAAFPGAVVGILDYSFGNYKLYYTSALPAPAGGPSPETLSFTAPLTRELTVATLNVENLDPGDGAVKFNALAALIVNRLQSPDLLALEEVQDNNGAVNDSVVAADQTLGQLIAAIATAGGPAYAYRQIDPVDDQDGGEPGGNIRLAFLFRADRGLAFVDRPGGTAVDAVSVTGAPGAPALSFSPGRISPTDPAFAGSRKPLAGEFTFQGETLFVIANHFNSKGGDDPLFGRAQPPVRASEVQRVAQAAAVNAFVDSVLAVDPQANLIVLGDLNDFAFSPAVAALRGGVLSNLLETLPVNERYTYVFEGNAQALDHVLASGALAARLTGYDVVHVNAEFNAPVSDHDPSVARFLVAPLRRLYLPQLFRP